MRWLPSRECFFTLKTSSPGEGVFPGIPAYLTKAMKLFHKWTTRTWIEETPVLSFTFYPHSFSLKLSGAEALVAGLCVRGDRGCGILGCRQQSIEPCAVQPCDCHCWWQACQSVWQIMSDVFLRYCFFPLFSPHQLNKDPVAYWIPVVLKLCTCKWWLCFSSLRCIFKISVAVPRLEVIIKASVQSDVDVARIDCSLETCHKHVWSSHLR